MMQRQDGWRTEAIDGVAADIYEPTQPGTHGWVLLHLHGYGRKTLKDNPYFTAELEQHGMRCVCPYGERAWWLDRVLPEFDATRSPMGYLRESLLPWMEARWGTKPPAIGLCGNSMGGQGVLQLAYRYPRQFPVVAAICPAIDFQQWHGKGTTIDELFSSREAARQETAILQIHPLNWPRHQLILCDPADAEWFDGAERLGMKLSSMGIPFESDFTSSHGGHTWDYVNAMAKPALAFIADRLEQESRRIPPNA